MPPGSRVGMTQIARQQGFSWGGRSGQDWALWLDGDTLFTDANFVSKATRPWVDARAFGAVGDGVTDDAPALQAALDAAGGTAAVLVAPGHYKCNSTLRVVSNQTIIGLSSRLCHLDFSAGGGVTGIARKSTETACDNVHIRGLKITAGTVAGTSTAFGVDLENFSYALLEDVFVEFALVGFHLYRNGAGCFFNRLWDCRTRCCKYGIEYDDDAGLGTSPNANSVRGFVYEDVGVWDPNGIGVLLAGYGNYLSDVYVGGALAAGVKLGAVTGNCLMEALYVESGPTIGVDASAVGSPRRNVLLNVHFDTTPATPVSDPSGFLMVLTVDANATPKMHKLTLEQSTADDAILDLASVGDVAHGITDHAPTSVYARFLKGSATSGGLWLKGLGSGTASAAVYGYGAIDDATKATTSRAYAEMAGAKKSGTGVGNAGADANIVGFRNNATTRALVDAEGDYHLDATSNINVWDEHDDAAVGRALRAATLPEGHPVRRRFAHLIEKYRDLLVASKLVTFNADGHHFVNATRLTLFNTDAIWQMSERLAAQAREIAELRALLPARGS